MNKTFIQMKAVWLLNMIAWCRIKQVNNPQHDAHYNQRAEFYHQRYMLLINQ